MVQKEDCIFCKIAKGEIEPLGGGKFYEDDKFMAFLSPFPNTEGFSVVIPKEHYDSDVLQMPDKELIKFVLVSKTIAKKLVNHFSDVGRVGLIMEGTGINHAHIKLSPMHGTEELKDGGWKQYSGDNDKFFEKYEGYLSSNDGPKADDNKLKALAEELRNL